MIPVAQESPHTFNEAFQTLNSLLIDMNEILGQLAGQQQLVEQDRAMLPQELLAPFARDANNLRFLFGRWSGRIRALVSCWQLLSQ